MRLVPGEYAPDFEARGSNGKLMRLGDFQGKWLVLYFYPKDDTPGCSRQACSFRAHYKRLQALGAEVVGCNADDLKTHDKFITKYNLPFLLLSDPDHQIAADYGVWQPRQLYGRQVMVIERSTFLISPDGLLRQVWRKVKVDDHVDEIMDELKLVYA